jgi:hypothetical protein
MRSDDEDSKVEEHGDELTGTFVGCSSLADSRMTEQQAQELRASAHFSSALTYQPSETFSQSERRITAVDPTFPVYPESEPERKATPMNSDEDDSDMSDDQRRKANLARGMAERAAMAPSRLQSGPPPRAASRAPIAFDPVVQPPAKATPVTIVKATPVKATDLPKSFKQVVESAPQATQAQPSGSGSKKGKTGRVQASTGQVPVGTRIATRNSEVPKAQTPTTTTRKNPPRGQAAQVNQEDASGAGGLRGVAGSGQTGYVSGRSSPSPKPGS